MQTHVEYEYNAVVLCDLSILKQAMFPDGKKKICILFLFKVAQSHYTHSSELPLELTDTNWSFVRLTLMTRWKSSRLWGTSFLKLYVLTATAIPAQFTARSSLPNFSLARFTAACTSASDVTWQTEASQRVNWLAMAESFPLWITGSTAVSHTYISGSEGTALPQLVCQCSSIGGGQVQDHSRGSVLHQPLHSGPTQTGCSAGHQANHTLQRHGEGGGGRRAQVQQGKKWQGDKRSGGMEGR